MNSFKLFAFAKKLLFFVHLKAFFPSVALLCNLKKPSNGQKMTKFRLNAKSLNEFNTLVNKNRKFGWQIYNI